MENKPTYFYSPTTKGFYHSAIHLDTMPVDAIALLDKEYDALLEGQAQGKVITLDPVTQRPVATVPDNATQRKGLAQYQIYVLEQSLTSRRLREAMLTGDHTFVEGVDAQIKALRSMLT